MSGLIERAVAHAAANRARVAAEEAEIAARKLAEDNGSFKSVMKLVLGIEIPLDGTTTTYEEAGFGFRAAYSKSSYETTLWAQRFCPRCQKWSSPSRRILTLDDIAGWAEEGDEWHDCEAQAHRENDID